MSGRYAPGQSGYDPLSGITCDDYAEHDRRHRHAPDRACCYCASYAAAERRADAARDLARARREERAA